MRPKQTILFISHKANLSGAPALLLSIINAYKQKYPEAAFKILSLEKGPLVKEFEKLGKTYLWDNSLFKKKSVIKNIGWYFKRIAFILQGLYILLKIKNTQLIFFNTITNGHIHKKLLFTQRKSICYVHEMEAAIHMLTNAATLNTVTTNTARFLAVSDAVKQNLVNNYGVKENTVIVVDTPVSIVRRNKTDHKNFVDQFKGEHHIPGDAVIIGITGNNEWRKGFDLLSTLVPLYFNLFPGSNVYFVWKGFNIRNTSTFFDEFDLKRIKNNDRIILKPHDANNIEQMACFDIHLLLSREDPYPLVTLEAASFAIPTICFDKAGGSAEFVKENCGMCVPYLDLYKMAHAILILSSNASQRKLLGENAQQKLAVKHDEAKNMNLIIDIINSELKTV